MEDSQVEQEMREHKTNARRRKGVELESITVQVPKEIKQALKQQAAEAGVAQGAVVARLIARWVGKKKRRVEERAA